MKGLIWGNTVAVLGSGPSLTVEDIDLLRAHKVPMIAVNSTWKVCRDCIGIYAGDYRWWKSYGDDIDINVPRYSRSKNAERHHKAKYVRSRVKGQYNSGMMAVEVAILKGASQVIMLGFDCSVKNGIHHHGPHKQSPNPNPERCKRWVKMFEQLKRTHKQAKVVNCSRYTELKTYPVRPLEDVLCELG